jgi:hypothetical protein
MSGPSEADYPTKLNPGRAKKFRRLGFPETTATPPGRFDVLPARGEILAQYNGRLPSSRHQLAKADHASMKHLKSLREYIDELKKLGELLEIDVEVDWNLEVGAIARRSCELRAPAPLFNRIKGIERGFRVLGAPASMSRQKGIELCRVALSLGLPAETKAGVRWPPRTTSRRYDRDAWRRGPANRIG